MHGQSSLTTNASPSGALVRDDALIRPRPQRTWGNKSRGVIGLVILAPFAIVAVFSPPHFDKGSLVSVCFDAIGWLAYLAGATLRFWSTLYIGGRKGRFLATDGPYSMCRNPLYLGSFLILISIAIFCQSLTFGLGALAASVVYLIVTVPNEEARLRHCHGTDYDDYCRRVPRWLPDPRKYHSVRVIDVDTRCLTIEFSRALRWFLVPLGCELVVLLRGQPWWPHTFHLP